MYHNLILYPVQSRLYKYCIHCSPTSCLVSSGEHYVLRPAKEPEDDCRGAVDAEIIVHLPRTVREEAIENNVGAE